MAESPVIVARSLGKRYGQIEALKEASLEVARGEILGLIGTDGAGKTTLIRILATLLLPDSGSATVMGHDTVKEFRQIRNKVGYMPGKFSLYPDLSVKENLEFFATLFGTTVEKNYERIKSIYSHLEPFAGRKAGALSGGMKQKLALCCALVHHPGALLLDEPTTGVDPVSRKEFWDILAELKKDGIGMVVSTPYMDEATRCDRVALVKEGRIMEADTPQNLIARFPVALYAASGEDMYPLLLKIRELGCVESAYTFGDAHHITLKEGFTEGDLKDGLDGVPCEVRRIVPTIEDYYMKLK